MNCDVQSSLQTSCKTKQVHLLSDSGRLTPAERREHQINLKIIIIIKHYLDYYYHYFDYDEMFTYGSFKHAEAI